MGARMKCPNTCRNAFQPSRQMNVNVKAIINVSQVIAQGMMDHKIPGTIVNLSSVVRAGNG